MVYTWFRNIYAQDKTDKAGGGSVAEWFRALVL